MIGAEAIAGILANVTTPLAVIALLIIVIGNVLYWNSGKTLPAADRLNFASRLLWLIGVIAALTLLAMLAQKFLGAERVISGEIRSSDNSRLNFATVDVQNIGRYATAEDGAFNVVIPSSRFSASYKATVAAVGHAPLETELKGDGKPVSIRLEPVHPTAANALWLNDEMVIANLVGQPVVIVQFAMHNPGAKNLRFEDIRLEIVSPAGQKLLAPGAAYWPDSLGEANLKSPAPVLPLNNLELRPQEEMRQVYGFSVQPEPLQQHIWGIMRDLKLGDVPCFASKPGNAPQHLDPLTELRFWSFFDTAFYWAPGDYTVTVSAVVGAGRLSQSRKFSLSEQESSVLKAAKILLGDCQGISSFTLIAQKSGIANYLYRKGN